MRYSTIKNLDIANGSGCRVSIWFTGCNFHCKGCFNSEIWDFNSGEEFTQEIINNIKEQLRKPFVKGLSILGGEPLHQNLTELYNFIKEVKDEFSDKSIWLWTGYTKEELIEKCSQNEMLMDIMDFISVIVVGRFEESNSHSHHRFRGSSNQRIIEIQHPVRTYNSEIFNKDISEMIDNNRL